MIVEIRNVILFLLLVNILGCTPVPPKVIEVSKNQSFRPAIPDDVKNIDQAIAAVITAVTNLGLPGVDYLSLWLYPNTESFTYWGGWRSHGLVAADAAAYANGRNIHVNLESLAGGQSDVQVAVLAHEYGHTIQTVLGGYNHKGAAWFDEGFAEWVRTTTLNSLKWRNTELASRRTQRELNFHQGFELVEDRNGWRLHRREPGGYVKTYVLAFYAVDQLIRIKGLPAAIDYLKTGKFEQSFGQSQRDFEAALKHSIRQFPTTKPAQFVILKPQWKVDIRGPTKKNSLFGSRRA